MSCSANIAASGSTLSFVETCTSIGILRGGTLVHHDTLAKTLADFPGEDSLEEIYFQLESEPVS